MSVEFFDNKSKWTANQNSAANSNFFRPYFVGLKCKKVKNGNLSIKSVWFDANV